jgi:putative ABC transport system permease protein
MAGNRQAELGMAGPRMAQVMSRHNNEYPNPLFTDMLSNYLTIAFRNLWRHKAFTAINIIGLAVGMATCLLIVLFVLHELSYDRYHANASRIYRMSMHTRLGEKDIKYAYASEPAGPALLRDYPGVEAITRLRDDGAMLGYKAVTTPIKEEHVAFVDSNFFSFFSIPLLKGHKASVLVEPKTLVITETTARKYFGQDQIPIGKTLSMGDLGVFRVTGVCQDVPSNTHFHNDLFGSFRIG